MLIIIKTLLVLLLADFASGLFHWLEDVYIKPGMPFVHNIAVNNELHHTKPRAFLKNNWWQSSWDVAMASSLLVMSAWWAGLLSWEILLFAVLTTNANQIHKWAHQNRQEKPAVVSWLQQYKIIQTPQEHAKHHSGKKNSHYCVMTNVLNPVLEKVSFWRQLERLNHRLLGLSKNAAHEC